jgi:hypothetical protein
MDANRTQVAILGSLRKGSMTPIFLYGCKMQGIILTTLAK